MELKLPILKTPIRQPLRKLRDKNTVSTDSQSFVKIQVSAYSQLICKIQEQNITLDALNNKLTSIALAQKNIDMTVDTLTTNYHKQLKRAYSGGPSKCFFELGRRMKFII
ncbi:Hypothetical_protein [Hexamita inflata]|uniref:Hypothetical_protein n=1 Tax=Hexamita inflata TaxID=28002 RepID=A0AA86UT91_9EUKA|nr:Hypothetical protein HINF_LOCUS51451 [Hexamita inflata]